MYHDSLHLPVPATVRPIGMLGGGGASSKDGMSDGHRGRGGAQSQRGFTTTSAASSGAAASPAPATNGASPAATPSAASPNGLLTSATTSTAGDVGTPLDRPTITIFTELDDGASSPEEDAMHNTSTAASPWVSGGCGGHGGAKDHAPMTIFRDPTASMGCSASQRPPTALDPTETSLTPLHYRSLCSHPAGEDAPPSAYAFDPAAAMAASASSAAASPAPCFGRQTTEITSGEERTSPSSPLPGVTARMMASTSSNFSHGQPMQPSAMGGGAWPSLGDTTPPDAHPVRLSATPVVPIVPYVAEPSCRRRVAEDLERLYGSSSRQSAAAAAAAAAASSAVTADAGSGGVGVASTAGAEAGSLPLGGGAGAGAAPTAAEAAVKINTLVPETPKKKKSGLSFLSSSASSSAAKKAEKAAKAAAAAEAKKKAAPPTAAERRQAREQVIRVGVQRLYQRLNELHLVVYHVKNDGNCQFRAISHQLFGNESYHDIIRSQVVSYMRTARAESFDFYFESPAHADAYYDNLAKLGSWGDELSLRAASDCLYVNIHVLSSEEQNCYITYRPSLDRAASAPSFLIDIAKLQERRRAERRLLRSHGLRGSATSFASFDHTHVSPTLLQHSATGGGDYNGFGGAATMPDTYGRGRCSAASATAKAAPTLLVPASAACASRGGGSPHGAPPSSRPMSRNPSSVVGDFGDDDDEDAAAVDAHAIQLALHKKLQQSEIRCSLPLGASGACSLGTPTPTTAAGNGGMGHASMPLLQPQRSMLSGRGSNGNNGGGGGGASLLQPMAVPVPRLLSGDEDLTQGPKANQTERFRAVGAEVQPLTDATQSVNIFTQRMENVPAGAVMDNDDYLRLRQTFSVGGGEPKCDVQPPLLTQPARPTLLRPQMSAFADAPPTGGAMTRGRPEPLLTAASAPYMSPPPHPHDEPGEMMLFASSSHRGRPYPSRQQSFSCMQTANSFGGYTGGSTYAESFNAHPVHGSFSQSFAGGGGNGGAYAQSLGNLVPVPASGCGGSLPCGAADAMEGQGGQAGYFKFEPRTEAIDIFLSYLYPVHYNSLSVSPQQQPQPQPQPQQAAVNASTALAAPPAPACAATQESGTPLLTQQNLDGAITSARYLA